MTMARITLLTCGDRQATITCEDRLEWARPDLATGHEPSAIGPAPKGVAYRLALIALPCSPVPGMTSSSVPSPDSGSRAVQAHGRGEQQFAAARGGHPDDAGEAGVVYANL